MVIISIPFAEGSKILQPVRIRSNSYYYISSVLCRLLVSVINLSETIWRKFKSGRFSNLYLFPILIYQCICKWIESKPACYGYSSNYLG